MFKKVCRKTIDILFTLVIGLVLLVLATNYIGFNMFVVSSGSMEPNIHTGSVAIVNEKAKFSDMEEGDIIVFKLITGEMVTHRIEEITKIDGIPTAMTKGDANEMADGYTTTAQNFCGETIYSIPKLGYVMNWLNTVQGKIVIVASGMALLLLYMLLGDDEEKKNEPKAEPIRDPRYDIPEEVFEEDRDEIQVQADEATVDTE